MAEGNENSYLDLRLNQINDEVFIAADETVRLDKRAVNFIRDTAMLAPRGRARICMHKKPTDVLHEMLIAIRNDSYIRPHRHLSKTESFHLIEGSADIILLDDKGVILDIIEFSHDKNFYYRLDQPKYHTLLVHTPVLIIHEITGGPFDPTLSDFAAFAPLDGVDSSSDYVRGLKLESLMWKNSANSSKHYL